MSHAITFVGLDVHKSTIQVALLCPGESLALEWSCPHTEAGVRRLVGDFKREASGQVRVCYEAGPCGYALQRQLKKAGIECQVIAPSLIPVKPGERIKTDRRDARKLAELFRAGLLTEVHPPTEEDEALRDLCRAREDIREDLMRARHRMGKFLLRRGRQYDEGKRAWGTRHRTWLHGLRFERRDEQVTFDAYLLAIEQLEERQRSLEVAMAEAGAREPRREPVAWLRCFRGIDTVTAVSLVAELHDFRRFRSPRTLMAYLGLVPSENSSGERRCQGSITRAGNNHVRRLLVEAAWHYRHRPEVGATLRARRAGQPARVIAIADRAQERLWKRRSRMVMQGKPHNKIVVAQARELVGYLWAVLHPSASPTRA